MKAAPLYRNIPVVFLTGDEDVKTETAGLHAGAADFIRKPFAADVLLTEVVCILGADMVINHHTRSLPAMLIIAAVGVFGSIAVARFVARKENPR